MKLTGRNYSEFFAHAHLSEIALGFLLFVISVVTNLLSGQIEQFRREFAFGKRVRLFGVFVATCMFPYCLSGRFIPIVFEPFSRHL